MWVWRTSLLLALTVTAAFTLSAAALTSLFGAGWYWRKQARKITSRYAQRCLQLLRRLAIWCVQAAETKAPEGKFAAVKAFKSESNRKMVTYTHVPEGALYNSSTKILFMGEIFTTSWLPNTQAGCADPRVCRSLGAWSSTLHHSDKNYCLTHSHGVAER